MKTHQRFFEVAGGFIRAIHAFLDAPDSRGDEMGETAAAMSLDPVCGRWVPTGSMALCSNAQGRKFFFCSEMCKLTFDCNPEES